MFRTLSKYGSRTVAKLANASTNVAKATPGYLDQVSTTFKEEWTKNYTEPQRKRDRK